MLKSIGHFVEPMERYRSKTSMKLSPSKNKRKRRKSSVLIKLATIPRPNVLYKYLSYNEIEQYLDYIEIRFSNFVNVHILGTTFEGRSIKCIEIDFSKDSRVRSASLSSCRLMKSGRNIVFIEGGTHAREWITVTVALNCIHQLTEKYVRHKKLLRKLIFYVVPVVNPDGYEYARNVNPRWRKNRCPHRNGEYVGTDCNRNFDFHWVEGCSKAKRNTYQGDKPFSEHETKALATILHSLAPKLLFFLSLHSYAQTIMYPWGYSNSIPKNAKLMESVAIAGRDAIKELSGRNYRVGSIARITKRNIGGAVVDYAYGAVKIPLTLVMELPSSKYGFQPPTDKIYPLGMESWHGIKEMCEKAYSLKSLIEDRERVKVTENKTTQTLRENKITCETAHFIEDSLISAETERAKMLQISCDTEKAEEIHRNLSVSLSKNSTLRLVQTQMAKGVITSMIDETHQSNVKRKHLFKNKKHFFNFN